MVAFNLTPIIFLSVCAALSLLFLISIIVVAVKGKRKCGAFDVILRILASLAMVVSAVLVACSVLTMLNTVDGLCIVAVQDKGVAAAFLVMGTDIVTLPMPEIFVLLSTGFGFGLLSILFILSLTALIVDCLVANKKEGKKDKKDNKKKKEPAVKKSPEQLKREAELERIRRIGESAVRKTERVAKAEKEDKISKDEQPEKAEQPATETPTEDEQPAVDWREQPKEEQHSEFVGLKDEGDDAFDSFDTFDDEPQEDAGGAQDYEQADDYDEQPVEEAVNDGEYAEEQTDEYAEQPDDYAEEQVDEYVTEEGDEQPTDDIYYDEDEQYTYDDGTQAEEYAEQTEEPTDGEYEAGEGENYDYADEQPTDEYDGAPIEQPIDIGQEVERILETPTDDIEPDRGIYIPEIRTVTPRPTDSKPTAVKKPAARPTTQRATAKAPRTAKPKKSGSGGASQRPVIPPEKKLPVTRRYVILDRHNAVNMFGEYLKERNQAEKDKLKSSINTIIIE
ncbi:MAG: hypothetical protein K2M89_03205 [Clostridiales bacterium]|nr:hypothetical protein [Clostridiales bacterium]